MIGKIDYRSNLFLYISPLRIEEISLGGVEGILIKDVTDFKKGKFRLFSPSEGLFDSEIIFGDSSKFRGENIFLDVLMGKEKYRELLDLGNTSFTNKFSSGGVFVYNINRMSFENRSYFNSLKSRMNKLFPAEGFKI